MQIDCFVFDPKVNRLKVERASWPSDQCHAVYTQVK